MMHLQVLGMCMYVQTQGWSQDFEREGAEISH